MEKKKKKEGRLVRSVNAQKVCDAVFPPQLYVNALVPLHSIFPPNRRHNNCS